MVVTSYPTRIIRAAEELINRDVQRFPANVPQRLIDARHRRPDERPGAIESVNVHRLPQVLDLHRIIADKKIAEVLNAGHGRPGFAFERAFAPALNAL